MGFNEIVGQKEIIAGLKHAFKENRIGHAYIFSGPRGIGKSMLAGTFAGLLLCQEPREGEACGQCASCGMQQYGSNPDFHKIGQRNESIGVEEIRKLQGEIMVKPVYSPRKVYLISDAENMTIQAQNCLLKILEEPPGYVVFLLATSNYGALLETIRSRAIRYNFKKNTVSEVRTYLESRVPEKRQELDFIVSYADGVIGTALELAGSEDFAPMRDKVTELILRIANSELLDIFEIYDFFETNKHRVDRIFDIMLMFYRDLLIVKKAGKENLLINSDKKDIILGNVSRFSAEKLAENIEFIEKTRLNIKQNANYQLSIEVMLMKLQEESLNGKGGWNKV